MRNRDRCEDKKDFTVLFYPNLPQSAFIGGDRPLRHSLHRKDIPDSHPRGLTHHESQSRITDQPLKSVSYRRRFRFHENPRATLLNQIRKTADTRGNDRLPRGHRLSRRKAKTFLA